jgi:predicted ATPase/DNA-binding SARP family transcriptional activator
MLVVQANQVVPGERLANELWPGLDRDRAVANLQVRLSELRKALRSVGETDPVITRAPGYLLRVTSDEVDALRFAELVAAGSTSLQAGDPVGAVGLLDEAVGLWRGPPLADLQDAPWVRAEVARLGEDRLAALEWRVEARLACDEHGDLIGELEGLTGAHPLRERFWAQRMLALYRSGRQADALRAYQQVRAILVEELGIDPSRELRELETRILAQDAALHNSQALMRATGAKRVHDLPLSAVARTDTLLVTPAEVAHNNLPVQRSRFIGRKAELDDVADLVRAEQLVTLTGIGGGGKTRLALEAATRLVDDFPRGAFFVDLGPLTDRELVAQAVASALGLPTLDTGVDRLAAHFANQRILMVLDNCEHLLDSCADLVDTLLALCPHLHVLATSRENLGLDGEQAYRVPSMTIADEATALFVDRARAVRPSLRIDRETEQVIVEICERLDGIPLAIELAAGRTAHLPPAEILKRLSDLFHVLTGGRRRVPRQQTLAAAMSWSHDLLSEHEQVLFRRLAAFHSPFSLAAAELVCGAAPIDPAHILDLLGSLVDKCLVAIGDAETDLSYRMLVTVRAYAHEQLLASGELQKIRRAHLDYVLKAIAGFPERPGGSLANELMRPMEALDEDIRAAFEYALQINDRTSTLNIAARFGRYAFVRGRWSEGLARSERALAGPAEPASIYGWTLYGAVLLSKYVDDKTGEFERTQLLASKLLAFGQNMGDQALVAYAWHALGNIAQANRDYDGARTAFQNALSFTVDARHTAVLRREIGEIALEEGDSDTFRACIYEVLAVLSEQGHTFEIARTASLGGIELAELGDPAAPALLAKGLVLGMAHGYSLPVARALVGLARNALDEGRPRQAAMLVGAAEQYSEQFESDLATVLAEDEHRVDRIAALKHQLARELSAVDVAAAYTTGRSLPPIDAVQVAAPGLLHDDRRGSRPGLATTTRWIRDDVRGLSGRISEDIAGGGLGVAGQEQDCREPP